MIPSPPPNSIYCHNYGETIFPPVIVWDPYISISTLNVLCVECNQKIERKLWKLGQSPAFEPRIVHDINSVVVLISCQYICLNNHTYLTTDPRLLQQISPECVPFVLLHKTGFLKSFIAHIVGLVNEGLGISAVERFIRNQRKNTEACLTIQAKDRVTSLDRYISLIVCPYPSNDVICKCFISEFLLNQAKYTSAMAKITATNLISFDHTFKVAANVGYLRNDGKWISQYNSVFIVMNQKGMVLGWQFTKSTGMDEVKQLFCGLIDRITDFQNLIIIADNCCSIKGKLTSCLGENINVKLDLFHAVQRITRKISKRHPLFKLCADDLRLVFRQSNDLGHKRETTTPDSCTILENINNFVRKWKGSELKGWKIINENVLSEIEHLKVHIAKGCLSGLPKGAGTNKNERLHRHLKPLFSRTRLGLPLALAMMTILLFQYNCRLIEKHTGTHVSLESECATSNFQFGIADKNVQHNLWGISKNLSRRHSFEAPFKDAIKPFELSECIAQIISVEGIMNIIEKAFHLSNMSKLIQKTSGSSSVLRYQFFPFMSSVSSLYFSSLTADSCNLVKLDGIIKSWKMKRYPVSKDGNCCFVSVAIGLQVVNENLTSLSSLHPDLNFGCTATLSQQLRFAAVKEWKSNSDYYSEFFSDVEKEADRFNQLGFFASDLGDSVLVALSNAIGMQFIVFTAQESHPVVYISPREVKCGFPIYLAFSSTGSGHYDAVIKDCSLQIGTQKQDESITARCSCGKNMVANDIIHCVPIKSKYDSTIRCPCLINKKACTSHCRCRNCGNDKEPATRKRRQQPHQITIDKSAVFGCKKGEDMCPGSRSTLEFFVLEEILSYLNHQDLLTTSAVHTLYNEIVDVAESFVEDELPIGKKSMEDIDKFLREHEHNLQAFTSLCNMQIQLALSTNTT